MLRTMLMALPLFASVSFFHAPAQACGPHARMQLPVAPRAVLMPVNEQPASLVVMNAETIHGRVKPATVTPIRVAVVDQRVLRLPGTRVALLPDVPHHVHVRVQR